MSLVLFCSRRVKRPNHKIAAENDGAANAPTKGSPVVDVHWRGPESTPLSMSTGWKEEEEWGDNYSCCRWKNVCLLFRPIAVVTTNANNRYPVTDRT
jgi:hypothetical protein